MLIGTSVVIVSINVLESRDNGINADKNQYFSDLAVSIAHISNGYNSHMRSTIGFKNRSFYGWKKKYQAVKNYQMI
jgi:hypothetical protein